MRGRRFDNGLKDQSFRMALEDVLEEEKGVLPKQKGNEMEEEEDDSFHSVIENEKEFKEV